MLAQREFERPLVLEAGAGTGKTAVLVARIVVWSLGPGWERAEARERVPAGAPSPDTIAGRVLRGIVAITFTEAAAAEMASRVGRALLEVRRGCLPPGLDASALPESPKREARAEALIGALDALGARTIHAFCRRLLSAHALEAGLHPSFEVDADGSRQAEIAREVLEAALPRAFAEPPDPDYELLASKGVGPQALEQELIALLGEGVETEDLAEDPAGPAAWAELWDRMARAAGRFAEIDAGRLARLGKRASRIVRVAEAVVETRDLLVGSSSRVAPAVETGSTPKAPTPRELLDRISSFWEPEDLRKLRDLAKGRLGPQVERAIGDDADALAAAAATLCPLLELLVRLDPERFAAARRVLHGLLAEARNAMRARGVVGFEGLLRGARDLLKGHPAVVDRWRREIDQILVDEFQDTDALQCELLEMLAWDGRGSARPGLFLVGDPKQSIYGWRSADLAAYEAFVERARAAGGRVLSLVVNFRSVPAVLDEVERVVAPIMHRTPALQPAFEPLLPRECVEPASLPEGCASVEHWVGWGLDAEGSPDPELRVDAAREIEARAVAWDLQRLRSEGVSLCRVALLLRTLNGTEPLLEALRAAGILYQIDREEAPGRRREMQDALAWIRCILDPADTLALVATLRSSLVGVPDAAWTPLWRMGLPGRAARLREEEPAELAALLADVRGVARSLAERGSEIPGLDRIAGWEEALVGFLSRLGGWRAAAEQGPVDRLLEALRGAHGLEASEAARYQGAHRLEGLDQVMRELAEALEHRAGSLSGVLSHLRATVAAQRPLTAERSRGLGGGDEAVQILTMHGAKGLGFDHVYLLGMSRRSRPGSGSPRRVWRSNRRLEMCLLGAPSPGSLDVELRDSAREEHERVRLLYVGMTRARERLVLSGCHRAGPPETVRSHADLLHARRNAPEDPGAWMVDAKRRGESAHVDADGVLWRFPQLLGPDPEPATAFAPAEDSVGPARVREEERQLEARRREADAHAARPFRSTPSGSHEGLSETAGPGAVGDDEERPDRREALALGTAIHRALEVLCFDEPPERWRERLAPWLSAAVHTLGGEQRADELLERFLASPLPARLHALAPHIWARELPMLLAPEAGGEGAVGFVAGVLDLLYRDPADGRLVVADYKTDRLEPGPELRARALDYAEQGRLYVEGVQRGLGLAQPPRFELWFLHAGEVTVLPER